MRTTAGAAARGGAPAFLADEAAHPTVLKTRTPEHLAQAVADANLRFPEAAATLAASLGVEISEKATPHLYVLLRRSLADTGLTSHHAKSHFRRERPFVRYYETCFTPEIKDVLRRDSSYPSGHAAIGWAWALILCELAPERANVVLKRGDDFGESRAIGGVHWTSDVAAGRIVGAAVVARLHANPAFAADLAGAGGHPDRTGGTRLSVTTRRARRARGLDYPAAGHVERRAAAASCEAYDRKTALFSAAPCPA